MSSERRKNTRIDIAGDYFYYPGKKTKKINCMIKNISITGACISSENTIKNNDVIFLHIKGARNIVLKSKTVWKIDDQYGLLFLLDTTEEFENISYIMNNVLKNNS